jgi:hypothetical protein
MFNSCSVLGTEDIQILKLENATFYLNSNKFGRNVFFFRNLDIMFKEVHRVRISTPDYFKITFGTVHF